MKENLLTIYRDSKDVSPPEKWNGILPHQGIGSQSELLSPASNKCESDIQKKIALLTTPAPTTPKLTRPLHTRESICLSNITHLFNRCAGSVKVITSAIPNHKLPPKKSV